MASRELFQSVRRRESLPVVTLVQRMVDVGELSVGLLPLNLAMGMERKGQVWEELRWRPPFL